MINYVIIDPDTSNRMATEKCLQQFTHLQLLVSCNTTEEARATMNENKTDILFIAVPLPSKDSLDFLNTLNYKKPALVITSPEKKYTVQAFDLDALDFIPQPVT